MIILFVDAFRSFPAFHSIPLFGVLTIECVEKNYKNDKNSPVRFQMALIPKIIYQDVMQMETELYQIRKKKTIASYR